MGTEQEAVGAPDGAGVWSVTVEIGNASGQDLVLDPANTTPPMSWIGEPPAWGSTLPANGSVTIAAAVFTPQAGVSLVLGYRNGEQVPVMITAGAGPDTQNGCAVERGSGVQGEVTPLNPGDPQHLSFAVRLTA